MKYACLAALGLLLSACMPETTASIDITRAEAPVRKSCPAFRNGPFAADAARTYGVEQITNFTNASSFACQCVAKSASQPPACRQVRQYSAIRLEP